MVRLCMHCRVGICRKGGKTMALIRWNPQGEFEEREERLRRAYGRQALGLPAEGGKEALTVPDWAPAVDIAETPEEFLIKVELPEVKKEDVKVTVESGVLRIEGERRQEKEEKTKKFHRIERAYGSFVRTFAVPDNIDEAKVSAEFKDGVLNVHLPKTEKAKHKAIEVKVG
jgi:HSP20 family protein